MGSTSADEEVWGIYIPDNTSVIIALVQQLTYRTVVVTPLYIPSSLSPYCAAAHIYSDQSFRLLSTSEGSRKTFEQEVAAYVAEKAANQAPQQPEQ